MIGLAVAALLMTGTPAAWAGTEPLPEADCTLRSAWLEIGGPYRARVHVEADVRTAGTFRITKNVGEDGQLGWLPLSGSTAPELHTDASTDYRITVSCPGSSLVVTGTTPPPSASPGHANGPEAVCRWEGLELREVHADSVRFALRAVVASTGVVFVGAHADTLGPLSYLERTAPDTYALLEDTRFGLQPDTPYVVHAVCDGDDQVYVFRSAPPAVVTVTGPTSIEAVGPTVPNPLTATARAASGESLSASCLPATLPLDRTTVVTCTSAEAGVAQRAVRVSGVDGQLRVLGWTRPLRASAEAARLAFASGDLGAARRRLLGVQRAAQQLPRWSRGVALLRVRQVAAVGGVTL